LTNSARIISDFPGFIPSGWASAPPFPLSPAPVVQSIGIFEGSSKYKLAAVNNGDVLYYLKNKVNRFWPFTHVHCRPTCFCTTLRLHNIVIEL